MRVLFISTAYYPHIGGVEYVVKSIAERLARMGHEITVLAGESEAKKPLKEKINGVNIIRWPTWSPRNAYHVPRLRSRLEETLRELMREVDVIHVHSVHTILSVWAGLKVIKMGFSGKVIVTPHYHGTGHTALRSLLWVLWRHYVSSLLKRSIVHAVSVYEAKLLKKHFSVESIVIEHGVDERILKLKWRPEDYVMYSGRIERYKNIDKLARIIKILNRDYGFNLKLRIYGDGSYKEKLLRNLDKLELKYKISAFQPYDQYLEILSRAKLFALLSEKEAFGQTINEANAIGVPVVVVKPWGENFRGRSRTLIVDLDDEDSEIARKISELLMNAPKQPKSKVPSWNEVVDKYLSVYKE